MVSDGRCYGWQTADGEGWVKGSGQWLVVDVSMMVQGMVVTEG